MTLRCDLTYLYNILADRRSPKGLKTTAAEELLRLHAQGQADLTREQVAEYKRLIKKAERAKVKGQQR